MTTALNKTTPNRQYEKKPLEGAGKTISKYEYCKLELRKYTFFYLCNRLITIFYFHYFNLQVFFSGESNLSSFG